MDKFDLFKKKLIAVLTAIISIMIGLVYLIIVFFLDSRGQMVPPPQEAFSAEEALSLNLSQLD